MFYFTGFLYFCTHLTSEKSLANSRDDDTLDFLSSFTLKNAGLCSFSNSSNNKMFF